MQIAGIHPANEVFTFGVTFDASYSLFTPQQENVLVLNVHIVEHPQDSQERSSFSGNAHCQRASIVAEAQRFGFATRTTI